MSGRGILDADMRTLGRLIAQGWQWWTGELRGLVPARFRRRHDDLPRLRFDAGQLVPAPRTKARGRRVAVSVPPELCLVRTLERPPTGERDVQRMLAFEADTVLPFPAGTTMLAARRAGEAPAGRMRVDVAGLPIATARAIAEAAAAIGARPVRVIADEPRSARTPLDFAPAMRAAGILRSARSATPSLWGLVAILAALNLATTIWRDTASLDRLEHIVADQQPAVQIAQTITRRAAKDRALAGQSRALRAGHDALGSLADTSRALADGAWLQRYVWDGAAVRLAGYQPAGADVAGALRRSGRFGAVRSLSGEGQTALPAGEPFDLTARTVR